MFKELVRRPPTGLVQKTWPHSALLVVGHGSLLNADSSAPTFQHAAELRRRWLFAEVQVGFWKEQPSFREALWGLEASEIYVVPNFISEGYFTQEIIPRELDLTGPVTHRKGVRINYCRPVGSHPLMTHVILKRAQTVLNGVQIDLSETCLFLIGHGTDQNENSARAIHEQITAIHAMGRYGEVRPLFLDQNPLVDTWMRQTNKVNVVMVPFFVSNGLHCYEDIPMQAGLCKIGERQGGPGLFDRNPHIVNGRRVWYGPAVGTEPHMADLILDLVKEFDGKFKSAS